MRQDYNGVRTAEDLERKYNLSNLSNVIEDTRKNKEELESLNTDLKNFGEQVTKDIGDLQNQLDGNITSWFENGVPTLNNFPASEWTTEELKKEHIGDLYYDQDTGYSYRFVFNTQYEWIKITDSDITKALAIANAAKDTADQKRRVFVTKPKPPYDNGDMWIKNKEIWICQVSKQDGVFEDRDFINELKYTDDTKANEVDGKLTIVKGQVTTIIDNVDKLQKTMTSTVDLVDSQGNLIGNLETKQSEITQTVEGINTRVTANKNELDSQSGELITIKNNQSTINQTINEIKTDITETKKSVDSNSTSINNLETNQSSLTQKVNGIETKVTTNKQTIDTQSGQITSLEKGQSQLNQSVNSLQSQITSNKENINKNKGNIQTLETNQSTFNQSLNNISTELSSTTKKTDLNTNKVASLETNQSEIKQSLNGLEISVSESKQDIENANTTINKVEEKLNTQGKTINIISTNIDTSTGEVRKVTTENGFRLDKNGLNINESTSAYNCQINTIGTYYRDGNENVTKTTKDGSELVNTSLKGITKTGYDGEDYLFTEELINVNGKKGLATYFNGGK